MARTSRGDFITWFTDNFLTGNPANITAAKMREFGNRIADNTLTTLAFLQLTAPQAMVGVNDATPTVVEMDYGTSSHSDEIAVDTVGFLIQPLLALFYGGGIYDVRGACVIDGDNGDIVNLGLYQDGVLLTEKQVELKGAGIYQTVSIPALFIICPAGVELTLGVTVPTGAPAIDINISASSLELINLPGMI